MKTQNEVKSFKNWLLVNWINYARTNLDAYYTDVDSAIARQFKLSNSSVADIRMSFGIKKNDHNPGAKPKKFSIEDIRSLPKYVTMLDLPKLADILRPASSEVKLMEFIVKNKVVVTDLLKLIQELKN